MSTVWSQVDSKRKKYFKDLNKTQRILINKKKNIGELKL